MNDEMLIKALRKLEQDLNKLQQDYGRLQGKREAVATQRVQLESQLCSIVGCETVNLEEVRSLIGERREKLVLQCDELTKQFEVLKASIAEKSSIVTSLEESAQ